ncbi:KICSTOR complex protein szt2 [Parelaphostrongylus tenuis]|uniref:KICSTOR complex protein szt2 n=1 Tax=Parelaphostrongylus tenuis TaxID=148309 RepID=A0AAD5NAL2_PARTN|nr:KICSTOR complex protein szt2 [Parelaphostrongylus tenuis]
MKSVFHLSLRKQKNRKLSTQRAVQWRKAGAVANDAVYQEADGNVLRDAKEIFIHMHRNFRVSRNIRAHWLFDHLNKTVRIEDSPGESEYSNEMTVVGIIAKNGEADDYVVGEEFRVCLDTKITYISRYYRHVFVLDLSPSTLVADEEINCCLHTKLLECLRLSMASVTKSFTIPGTRRIFCPQIYVSVCVFIPFLAFEQDLVLVQGVLLTESNINSVLHTVTQKFNDLLNGLYDYSKGILQKWGTLRRRHRNKFDSTCGDVECIGEYDASRSFTTGNGNSPTKVLNTGTSKATSFRAQNIMDYAKGVWSVSTTEDENSTRNPLCDGYVHPEWALIFMLRLGLIAVQMMPEKHSIKSVTRELRGFIS